MNKLFLTLPCHLECGGGPGQWGEWNDGGCRRVPGLRVGAEVQGRVSGLDKPTATEGK